jgi:hypothetical protein
MTHTLTLGLPLRPFAAVPTLNEWARVNFRPTTPTPSGRRPASRRLRKQWAREAKRKGVPGAAQHHMETHAKLLAMTPEEVATYGED